MTYAQAIGLNQPLLIYNLLRADNTTLAINLAQAQVQ